MDLRPGQTVQIKRDVPGFTGEVRHIVRPGDLGIIVNERPMGEHRYGVMFPGDPQIWWYRKEQLTPKKLTLAAETPQDVLETLEVARRNNRLEGALEDARALYGLP